MDAAQAQQLIEAHEVQIQALHAQVQSLLQQIQAQAQQLNDMAQAQPQTQPQAQPQDLPQLTRRPKPCLPDPDKFSGSLFAWDTWLPSIKAKLRIDGDAIGGHEAQFFYVYSRLDGKVQALVMPQLQVAEERREYDSDGLLRQLARLYDDPNKVRARSRQAPVAPAGS